MNATMNKPDADVRVVKLEDFDPGPRWAAPVFTRPYLPIDWRPEICHAIFIQNLDRPADALRLHAPSRPVVVL